MSMNTAHANGGVLIYNGEIILLYCDGVELIIEGNGTKDFGGTKKGRIYLTTHRMIFMNKSEKDPLQSFSFPFFSMSGLELEQPIFGANYIKGVVHAQAGGNWTGKATFKLKFFSGGAIEFGQAMLRAAQMANQNMPPQPPPYTPHQGPYYPAPPPAYMPPPGGINGFVPPTHVFPDAPPANSVYTMDMPPPYPGIYPPPYAFPPGSQAYPQAGPTGLVGYPGGPPPPGFAAGTAGAPPPGSQPPPPYNPQQQPAYNPQQQPPPGAYGQYNGVAQQPPTTDSKAGAPPLYDFYQDPYNSQILYAQQNMNGHQNPGPPPPYSENNKKNQ
ncbi:WW domain-binding protein 2-like isoform X2 [Stegodyphus dumicola]|uniref:WW domain-binding protein 2-like isoform X2 n=1 Tax=Stegodyphus dumicola TaxID=202533 RepID=UPI0015A9382A|nr:WW domain-binding protein 2-like isoform X2 [Stegodyphus dumicola]